MATHLAFLFLFLLAKPEHVVGIGQLMASPTDLVKTQIQMEGRRRLLGQVGPAKSFSLYNDSLLAATQSDRHDGRRQQGGHAAHQLSNGGGGTIGHTDFLIEF